MWYRSCSPIPLFSLLVLLVGVGCEGEMFPEGDAAVTRSATGEASPTPAALTCMDPADANLDARTPCECMGSYMNGQWQLDQEGVYRVLDAVELCIPAQSGDDLAYSSLCLPFVAGVDVRYSLTLAISMVCSDVCPEATGLLIHYVEVDETRCDAIGGVRQYDYAWGSYLGCGPAELNTWQSCR